MKDILPAAALERHIGILGKTGSGKSNTAKVLAERIMAAGGRVCVIDPTGTWWGIRLRPDGLKKSKFEPVIFGGLHADIPIAAEHGAVVAEAIATASSSAIIDTRTMTVGARTKFFTAFGEALLRTNRGPLHLIIDEAHLFAPQGRVNDPQSGAMLHAANNLVSLGRGIGLRIILISQRPAKLHKDSLTQVETLIALRLIAPQDRRAIEDWVGEWADQGKGKEITASLPSLPTGTAWVWSPEIDILEKVKFPLAATFDSGKAPGIGEAGPSLTPIDIEAIGAKMDAIRQEVMANDPGRLKRRISELEKQIAAAPKAEVDPKAIEDAKAHGYEMGLKQGRDEGVDHGKEVGAAVALAAVRNALDALRIPDMVVDVASTAFPASSNGRTPAFGAVNRGSNPRAGATAPSQQASARVPKLPLDDVSLGAERKPLALLAACYPAGYTEAQWASLAGFKRTGGTWGTYKSRLRTKAMIEQRGDLWFATEAGIDAIGGDMPDIPTDPEGRLTMWKGKVPGIGPMLDRLFNHYPNSMSREELAFACGLSAAGGTFGTYLSRLRSNGLIEEPERGSYRLAPAIMGDL